MYPLEPSYPTTESPEDFSIAEAQDKDQLCEDDRILKEERNKSPKEIQENTSKKAEEMNNPPKESQENTKS